MKLKQSIFYIIAISIPIVLFLLLELGLRAGNYGKSYPLFIKSEQFEGYWQPNPTLIKRYFAPNAQTPSVAPDTYLFKKAKAVDTFRIVTMGGSTMAGFPYGRFASPAGMLKQRLKASHPSRNIEIISVAMSSINTYTLLDISREVADIKPDAVLIYAGHNEFLGVMGVGSVYAGKGSHFANIVYLAIKELRLFQLLQASYYKIFSADTRHTTNNQRTVMAQVAKNKAIKYEDEIYQAGIEQFEQNINGLLSIFEKASIPVLISNLVANESDQAPFSSTKNEHLDVLSQKLISNAKKSAITSSDIALANKLAHADYVYAMAKKFEQSGDATSAHGYYQKAIDYDLLRFRAPSAFSSIIKNAATKHKAKFIDAHAFLHKNDTPLIGKNLMLEHLHPNHRGYFLLSEAFYEGLLESSLPKSEYLITREQAWLLSPLTKVDEIYADYKIAQLTSDYPFVESKQSVKKPSANDEITRIAIDRIDGNSWINTQQTLFEYYQKTQQLAKAANIAGLLFDAIPLEPKVARAASLLYLKANLLPLAQYYALNAVALAPADTNYQLSLAEIYFKLGKKEEAIARLDAILAMEPNNTRAAQIKQQIK